MPRRLYKGMDVRYSMELPVNDIGSLQFLTILLHTAGDNDVLKTYPADIEYINNAFEFDINDIDIVTLREGILWATVDFRENDLDYHKKIQTPYYIKYSEGAASQVIISKEEVQSILDEKFNERIESIADDVLDEVRPTIADLVDTAVDRGFQDIEARVDEAVDEAVNDKLGTIGEEIISLGDRMDEVEGKVDENESTISEHKTQLDELEGRVDELEKNPVTDPYDDTEIKQQIEEIRNKPFKTINGESIEGEGDITISGDGDVIINNPEYDDTEIKNRLDVVEGRVDELESDGGSYDDTAIKNRLEVLESIDHSRYALKTQLPTSEITNIKNRLTTAEGRIAALETGGGEGGGDVIITNPEYDDTAIKNRLQALESIDHNKYALKTQIPSAYDDTAIKNRIANAENRITSIENDTSLEDRVAVLESIDHSKYLTKHQTLKTINGQSLIGSGNITISGGSGSGSGCDCTPYDDSELRGLIAALQQRVTDLENELAKYHILTVDVTPDQANLNVN